jgi:hypothetical protein
MARAQEVDDAGVGGYTPPPDDNEGRPTVIYDDGRRGHFPGDNQYQATRNDAWFAAQAASGPDAIAAIQRALDSAGILKGQYALGHWDAKSIAAFAELRNFAGYTGAGTLQDALTAFVEFKGQTGRFEQPSQAQRPVPQVTNPADVRLLLKDASSQLRAGGGFDDATINRLVAVYQAAEVEDQRNAFAQEAFGQTVTAPRSAETLLRETVREEDPSGVGAREVADRYQEFLGALGSPVAPVKL